MVLGKEVLMQEVFLKTAEAAAKIGFQPQTLRRWRCRGCGPKYCRLGSGLGARVVYRASDLEQWMKDRTFESTAQEMTQ